MCDLQAVGGKFVRHRRYQVEHWQDPNKEQSRRGPIGHGRVRRRSVDPTGIKILGTPVGSEEFHLASTPREVGRRRSVLASHTVGSRSSMCVAVLGPVCRPTVPPFHTHRASQPLGSVCGSHDRGMQATMATLLEGMPGDVSQQRVAGQLATLPMRMGRVGFSFSGEDCPGSILGSWGDAIPQLANSFIQQVNGEAVGCVCELQNVCRTLDRSGFVGRPTWAELRSEVRPPPVSGRTWRVAAWLAVLRVFLSRIPLSGDRSACPVCCCRSGPPAFPLRTWSERGFVLRADKARVPEAARRVPHSDLGKTSSPAGHHDKQVRVSRVRGQPGPSPCCMPQVWETPGQGSHSGEDTRQSVPGSRGSGSPKRQVARHEHHSAGARCSRDRGLGLRFASAPRSSIGCGYHFAERRQCLGRSMCERCRCERSRSAQGTEGQGDQVRRVG